MITVDGICGNSASNARICGSTASTIDPFAARTYRGGSCAPNAVRTVFLEIPSRRAIARIAIPSARYNRRISAQSSTFIPHDRHERWVKVHRNQRVSLRPEPTQGCPGRQATPLTTQTWMCHSATGDTLGAVTSCADSQSTVAGAGHGLGAGEAQARVMFEET